MARLRRPRLVEDLRRWFAVGRNPELQGDVFFDPLLVLTHPIVAPPFGVIQTQDPGAGAEIIFTVPQGESWEVLCLSANLVASVVVANRNPVLRVDDPTNVIFEADSPSAITASQNVRLSWGVNLPRTAVSNARILIPTPLLRIPPGGRILTTTINLDVGDDWGVAAINYLRHPVPGV